MTFSVSRPRAHLSGIGESDGLLAMRCTWQPMGLGRSSLRRGTQRKASGEAPSRLAVHVVSLLSLGRQSLRQALPSWRAFQAVNVLSSSLRSLELSPGRTPYAVSAPK